MMRRLSYACTIAAVGVLLPLAFDLGVIAYWMSADLGPNVGLRHRISAGAWHSTELKIAVFTALAGVAQVFYLLDKRHQSRGSGGSQHG